MKKYIAPILREQFTQFYRFGYTYIAHNQMIEFVDIQNNETRSQLKEKFLSISPFEYEEDYIILELECASINESIGFEQFRLEEINKIYPLNQRAKNFIESRIDPRIRLEDPIFEKIIDEVNESIYCRELRDSHEKLWKYFDIEGKPEDTFNLSGFKEDDLLKAIKYRREGKKSFQVKGENYWVYVMLYERKDAFPIGILGAFYDAGQLFAHSKGFPDFTGKGKLYPALENLSKAGSEKFELIISEIEKKDELQNYRGDLTIGGIRYYRITPIFQLMKAEIRKVVESGIVKNGFNLIENVKKSNYLEPNEYKILVTLLAYFFGYKTFYRELYSKSEFKFFREEERTDVKLIAIPDTKAAKEPKSIPNEPTTNKNNSKRTNQLEVLSGNKPPGSKKKP